MPGQGHFLRRRRALDGRTISDSVAHSAPVHHGPSEPWSPAVPQHAKLQSPNKGRAPPGGRRFPWILGLPKYFPVFEPGVEDFVVGKREEANKTKQKPGKGRPTEFHATQAAE